MRKLKRIILVLMIVFLTIVGGIFAFTILRKDLVVDMFLTEVNKSLEVPVDVESINLSLFSNFPNLSITLKNVVVEESGGDYLGKLERMHFNFNLLKLIRGKYSVNQLVIQGGELYLKEDEKGRPNYLIIKTAEETTASGDLSFDIQTITLDDVRFSYALMKSDQHYTFTFDRVQAGLDRKEYDTNISLKGSAKLDSIKVNDFVYRDKPLELDVALTWLEQNRQLFMKDSELRINGTLFSLNGQLDTSGEIDELDLQISAPSFNLGSLTAVLPQQYSKQVEPYQSKGRAYLEGSLSGPLDRLAINVDFGFDQATIMHPEYRQRIKKVSLKGNYYSPDVTDLEKSVLGLKDIRGMFSGEEFRANFELQDLKRQLVRFDVAAILSMEDLLVFAPIEKVSDPGGTVEMDLAYAGEINRNRSEYNLTGELEVRDVSFTWNQESNPKEARELSGHFLFNKEDVAISDLSGYVGRSQFTLNGFLRNVLLVFLKDDVTIDIEADMTSELIDLDELLTLDTGTPRDTVYQLSLPENLRLQFDCNINALKFRRFMGKDTYGKVTIRDQRLRLDNLTSRTAGGVVNMNSFVDAGREDSIYVTLESSYDGLNIDSVFFIFENFNQDFLTDQNLRGQVYATVNTSMAFDRELNLNYGSLMTESSFTIRKGELNDFEPMQRLAKFVDEKNLDQMRFSDLENRIFIRNRTLTIPSMEVGTNVTNIQIRGTHDFDQNIEYFVKLPLRRKYRDKDEAFGAISDDGTGKTSLFLIIRGTTDDYKIAYDTKAVREKIRDDIRKEGRELKEAFKNKGRDEKKVIELEEEEYFDFEEDTVPEQ